MVATVTLDLVRVQKAIQEEYTGAASCLDRDFRSTPAASCVSQTRSAVHPLAPGTRCHIVMELPGQRVDTAQVRDQDDGILFSM